MERDILISPSAMLNIIAKIEQKLWNKFDSSKYKNIERYLSRWTHDVEVWGQGYEKQPIKIFYEIDENFIENIDVIKTLDNLNDETLFKIAVDLNIEIPELIYSVAEIKGILAIKYEDAGKIFEKACKKIYSEPETAISMANSALELIIKRICTDNKLKNCNPKDTGKKLIEHILKEFNFFPNTPNLNQDLIKIASSMITISQSIENIRSNHTLAHGTEDEIIKDPIYATLTINAVSTLGLFLLNYYEKYYTSKVFQMLDDDVPF